MRMLALREVAEDPVKMMATTAFLNIDEARAALERSLSSATRIGPLRMGSLSTARAAAGQRTISFGRSSFCDGCATSRTPYASQL